MKLTAHPFNGDKKCLWEFIENVDVAFELVHPNKNDILLKFVKTKITGDARSKLIVRDLNFIRRTHQILLNRHLTNAPNRRPLNPKPANVENVVSS